MGIASFPLPTNKKFTVNAQPRGMRVLHGALQQKVMVIGQIATCHTYVTILDVTIQVYESK